MSGSIRILTMAGKRIVSNKKYILEEESVEASYITQNGRYVAWKEFEKDLQIYDTGNEKIAFSLPTHHKTGCFRDIIGIFLTEDCQYLTYFDEYYNVYIYNIQQRKYIYNVKVSNLLQVFFIREKLCLITICYPEYYDEKNQYKVIKYYITGSMSKEGSVIHTYERPSSVRMCENKYLVIQPSDNSPCRILDIDRHKCRYMKHSQCKIYPYVMGDNVAYVEYIKTTKYYFLTITKLSSKFEVVKRYCLGQTPDFRNLKNSKIFTDQNGAYMVYVPVGRRIHMMGKDRILYTAKIPGKYSIDTVSINCNKQVIYKTGLNSIIMFDPYFDFNQRLSFLLSSVIKKTSAYVSFFKNTYFAKDVVKIIFDLAKTDPDIDYLLRYNFDSYYH